MNIPNAYEDERFDPSVDEGIGFKHKSILCMAIKNSSGQIIGVIQVCRCPFFIEFMKLFQKVSTSISFIPFQLINKFNYLPFTKNDENFVEAFAIFCGMGIHNTHM